MSWEPDKFNSVKRHTNFAFPAYRFVPGFSEHPAKNPEAKHVPDLPDTKDRFSVQNWQKSLRYLYAIDLFNNSYYWEVHEVLEKLWLESGKDSDEGVFLKGLIQIAIALLKKIEGNKNGHKRLNEKAIPRICSQSNIYLGVDVDCFIKKYSLFVDDKKTSYPIIRLQFSSV